MSANKTRIKKMTRSMHQRKDVALRTRMAKKLTEREREPKFKTAYTMMCRTKFRPAREITVRGASYCRHYLHKSQPPQPDPTETQSTKQRVRGQVCITLTVWHVILFSRTHVLEQLLNVLHKGSSLLCRPREKQPTTFLDGWFCTCRRLG